jgi:hypothetical protein
MDSKKNLLLTENVAYQFFLLPYIHLLNSYLFSPHCKKGFVGDGRKDVDNLAGNRGINKLIPHNYLSKTVGTEVSIVYENIERVNLTRETGMASLRQKHWCGL